MVEHDGMGRAAYNPSTLRWALLILLGVPVACRFDPSGTADDGGTAGDGSDAVATTDAEACVSRCVRPDEIIDCGSATQQPTMCEFGCVETPVPHCRAILPSNGLDDALLVGAEARIEVLAGEVLAIDPDSGEMRLGEAVIRLPGNGVQSGVVYQRGPPYHVFGLRSLAVNVGGTVRIKSDEQTSPLVLYAADYVVIDGLLDVSAGCLDGRDRCGGPGGGIGGVRDATGATGCGPGGRGGGGGANDVGGGGGGFGSIGGAGGASPPRDGGTAGPVCGTADLVPLIGGSGGGRGGFGQGDGGGGGGAVQITARASIRVGGAIDAGGGGGRGGGALAGGGGGGAGGGVLLEAPIVEISATGIVAANGGGGGAGQASGGPADGEGGTISVVPAAGGMGPTSGGSGGAGAPTVPATAGSGPGSGTGGGGGGVGRIRINTAAGGLTLAGSTSPAPSTGTIVLE